MNFVNLSDYIKEKVDLSGDIIFVSDFFLNNLTGGAELSVDALLKSSPFKVSKVRSSDVTMDVLQKGFQKYWIFGNIANLDLNLIPTICANLRYSFIEFDFKFCKYRSIEKHAYIEKKDCDCHNDTQGKVISAFMYAAKSIWWMSEKQQEIYEKRFPFLKEKTSTVLSSIFDDETFASFHVLKTKYKDIKKSGTIILKHDSWIKGSNAAKALCEERGYDYTEVGNVPYYEMLDKLATAERFVFLPAGADTCPRIVIEAKLLGCELVLNENVQHKDEIWFDTDKEIDTVSYLYAARERFWSGIKLDMEYVPSISGYTTTFNCVNQDYPFVECITSMLGFCNEVVIVDGGSTDGTWEKLNELKKNDDRIVLYQCKRDMSHNRFAVFDGMQKALARSLCTSEFCWQQDSDEIVHENDYEKVKSVVKQMPQNLTLLCLPVIEYWGPTDNVRLDITLWKWRLSRNDKAITHGIPDQLRLFDNDGELYARQGTDGCDYVSFDSYKPIPSANFYTKEVDALKSVAIFDPTARNQLQDWFKLVINQLPAVHHYSWFNIRRKIRTYKNYWGKHWASLYGQPQDDSSENNKFFNKPWSVTTDEEIDQMADRLKNEMGGWIFHRHVDFSNRTLSMKLDVKHPVIMSDWIDRNKH